MKCAVLLDVDAGLLTGLVLVLVLTPRLVRWLLPLLRLRLPPLPLLSAADDVGEYLYGGGGEEEDRDCCDDRRELSLVLLALLCNVSVEIRNLASSVAFTAPRSLLSLS